MTEYYFDSRGRWVAFRTSATDKNLFDTRSRWLGWLAWGNDDVSSARGTGYLGTLVGDRFLRKTAPPSYFAPFTPFAPFSPFTPFAPFTRHSISMPSGYRDVD